MSNNRTDEGKKRSVVEEVRVAFCEGNYEDKNCNEISCKEALLKSKYESMKCHHCSLIDEILRCLDAKK